MQRVIDCTLYELVQGLSTLTNDEYEILAAVVLLVNGGRVRLRGPFADLPLTISTPLFLFPPWLRSALREHRAGSALPLHEARQMRSRARRVA